MKKFRHRLCYLAVASAGLAMLGTATLVVSAPGGGSGDPGGPPPSPATVADVQYLAGYDPGGRGGYLRDGYGYVPDIMYELASYYGRPYGYGVADVRYLAGGGYGYYGYPSPSSYGQPGYGMADVTYLAGRYGQGYGGVADRYLAGRYGQGYGGVADRYLAGGGGYGYGYPSPYGQPGYVADVRYLAGLNYYGRGYGRGADVRYLAGPGNYGNRSYAQPDPHGPSGRRGGGSPLASKSYDDDDRGRYGGGSYGGGSHGGGSHGGGPNPLAHSGGY